MGTIIIDKETGREFEVLGHEHLQDGRYGGATHFFSADTNEILAAPAGVLGHVLRLRLVPKRHTFGGVVFEETNEKRKPNDGEFFLGGVEHGLGVRTQHGSGERHEGTYIILRPVTAEAL